MNDSKNKCPYFILSNFKNAYKLVLPENISGIGNFAFYKCNLSEIILNENLLTIGYGSFSNSKIKLVTIPKNIKSIFGEAFSKCSNLEEIIIKAPIKNIHDYTFENCEKSRRILKNERIKQ